MSKTRNNPLTGDVISAKPNAELPADELPVDPYELGEALEGGNGHVERIDWDTPLIHVPETAIGRAEPQNHQLEVATGDKTFVTISKGSVQNPTGIQGEGGGFKGLIGNPRAWLVFGGGVVMLLVVAVALSGGGKEQTQAIAEPVTKLESGNNENLQAGGNPGTPPTYDPVDKDGKLTSGTNAGNPSSGKSPTPMPSLTPKLNPAPAPRTGNENASTASPAVERRASQPISEDFTVNTRAGEQAAALRERQMQETAMAKAGNSTASPGAAAASGLGPASGKNRPPVPLADLVKGQRIMMYTAEPFRTGVATVIQAQVLQDVRDKSGKIIFPAGTIAILPMSAIEANGRAIMQPEGMVVFQTPAGEYGAYGELKGADGFVGLKGNVKKLGGRSSVKRVLGGAINVASGAIGRGTAGSGVEGEVSEAVRDESYELGRTVVASNQVVEIAKEARCTLIIR